MLSTALRWLAGWLAGLSSPCFGLTLSQHRDKAFWASNREDEHGTAGIGAERVTEGDLLLQRPRSICSA